jgi:hypothetical protein
MGDAEDDIMRIYRIYYSEIRPETKQIDIEATYDRK